MRLRGGSRATVLFASSLLALTSLTSACVPRPRMCTASIECGGTGACVAGRCQLEKPTVKPAVDSARRVVVHPVDIGYSKTGAALSEGAVPSAFALGKDGGKLFLRFSVPASATANVVEAYLVLHRSPIVDDDPAPIYVHAVRIVDPWVGGSIAWARQPRSSETRSPTTTVEPAGGPLVRVDVRELVRQWGRRDSADHGIAVVAENETTTGTTFAVTAVGVERVQPEMAASGRSGLAGVSPAPEVEPYLELYVR